MGVALSFLYQLVFFYPFFVVYVPSSSYFDLLYIVTVSVLSGITISINIVRMFSNRLSRVGFAGSGLAILSGLCACTAFILISLSSGVLGIFAAFLTRYELYARIVSVTLLVISFYFVIKR
jgi:hypothetical protein